MADPAPAGGVHALCTLEKASYLMQCEGENVPSSLHIYTVSPIPARMSTTSNYAPRDLVILALDNNNH